jgi:hypothetical protein
MTGDEMMIVVVNVMLRAGAIVQRSCGVSGGGLLRDSAPDTKASARRQRTSAFGAGVARLVRGTGRRQVLRRRAPRHALDRFYRRSHSLGIGFGPAKIAGESLKKLFDLMAFEGLIIPLVLLYFVPLWIVLFWIGRTWMVCAHGNLMADIVREFAPWRMLNLALSSIHLPH